MRATPRYIGLEFDPYRPWNRNLLKGIEAFAVDQSDWQLLLHRMITGDRLKIWGTRERAHGMIMEIIPNWADSLKVPIVAINQPKENSPFPLVLSDFVRVGELAAEHLISKGYSLLACLEQVQKPGQQEVLRDQGFRSRAARHAVEVVTLPLPKPDPSGPHYFQLDDLVPHLKALRDLRKPAGVFARNLTEAYILHFLIREAGLEMSNELGLVVGGNDREQLEALKPSVTGISRNTYGIGFKAAEQLQRLFENQTVEPLVLIPPGGVIERESTQLERIGDEVVKRARQLIRERIAQSVDLAQLSRDLGVSERSLRRRFQAAVRHSPVEDIQQARLERAKELLERSRSSISEISQQCGFAETSQLSRVIKAATGLTPTQYRSHALRAQK